MIKKMMKNFKVVRMSELLIKLFSYERFFYMNLDMEKIKEELNTIKD